MKGREGGGTALEKRGDIGSAAIFPEDV